MIPSALLNALQNSSSDTNNHLLRAVPEQDRRDRSRPQQQQQQLEDAVAQQEQAQNRRDVFFGTGLDQWYEVLTDEFTFSSSLCALHPSEARVIVQHYEQQQQQQASSSSELTLFDPALVQATQAQLEPLRQRLQETIDQQRQRGRNSSSTAPPTDSSPQEPERVFVKLSTRSPKDSKSALYRASLAYQKRLSEQSPSDQVDLNTRCCWLAEEVTRAGTAATASDALELLLDSFRVYEDLQYALEGYDADDDPSSAKNEDSHAIEKEERWNISLVVRTWDPRIRPATEFRGVCWEGQLTCVGQYFHALYFPALLDQQNDIARDLQTCFAHPCVQAALALVPHRTCVMDFARVSDGRVVIIELNPLDAAGGLGTFPGSTGLFLWDDPHDQRIMKGLEPFELRVRTAPKTKQELLADFSRAWRSIVLPSKSKSTGN